METNYEEFELAKEHQDWNVETDGPLPEHCSCFDDEGNLYALTEGRTAPATGEPPVIGLSISIAIVLSVMIAIMSRRR